MAQLSESILSIFINNDTHCMKNTIKKSKHIISDKGLLFILWVGLSFPGLNFPIKRLFFFHLREIGFDFVYFRTSSCFLGCKHPYICKFASSFIVYLLKLSGYCVIIKFCFRKISVLFS